MLKGNSYWLKIHRS